MKDWQTIIYKNRIDKYLAKAGYTYHRNRLHLVAKSFQAKIGGKFAPLILLENENNDIDTMITAMNIAVTETTNEILGKHRRIKKPWVTSDILDIF